MKALFLVVGFGLLVGVIAWFQKDQEQARHRAWVRDQDRRDRGKGIDQSTWNRWPYDRGDAA